MNADEVDMVRWKIGARMLERYRLDVRKRRGVQTVKRVSIIGFSWFVSYGMRSFYLYAIRAEISKIGRAHV